ncbi:MAG: hypothetical protein V4726_10640 [Verrucomicrobiota bacterium]
MKCLPLVLLAALLSPGIATAQWITRNYSLKAGWNGIWMAGDASYTTVAELFAAYPDVTEVWRWNPNPDQIEFSQAPSDPTVSSEEWTVWKRNDPGERMLTRMVGNSSYLIRATQGSALGIKTRAVPPSATWLISGANFLGFPAAGTSVTAPTISSYFSSFPAASTTVLAPSTRIYKYIGGELGPSNPIQVAPGTERLDPGTAYWFNVAKVSNFTAPLEYEVSSSAGLAFGRTANVITVGVMNRSASSMPLTVSLTDSETAPPGQPGVTGPVPLTRRVFNSQTNGYDETPVSDGFTVTVPASGRMNLEFGINRESMPKVSSNFHASILRLKDTAGLSDVALPVSAQPSTPAGLWICQANVSNVENTVPGTSGSSTAQPFPLLFLIHMDSTGTPRLLSQVFTGRLTTGGNLPGLCISEDLVQPWAASGIKPQRYFCPQLPAVPSITGTGDFTAGTTSNWTITVPFDDATNPFVHTYHPDHDNISPAGTPLGNKAESHTITRRCAFTFTAAPPAGNSVTGWGSTVLGGTYAESLEGLNSKPLNVSGTFVMSRISDIAAIDLTPP